MTAVLLALGTALCYGVSNFIGPLISRTLPTMAVIVAGQTVALTVSGVLVLSVGVWLAVVGRGRRRAAGGLRQRGRAGALLSGGC